MAKADKAVFTDEDAKVMFNALVNIDWHFDGFDVGGLPLRSKQEAEENFQTVIGCARNVLKKLQPKINRAG